MLAVALLSLPLAYLAWKYVEAPFRKSSHANAMAAAKGKRMPLWPLGAAASAILAVAAISLPGRASVYAGDPSTNEIVNVTGLADNCESTSLAGCLSNTPAKILVWGDSYAMQIVPAIAELFRDRGVAQYTKSACNPIIGVSPFPSGVAADWPERCLQFNRDIDKVLDANPTIDTVVISTPMINLLGGAYVTADGRSHPAGDTKELEAKFVSTIEYLRKRGLKTFVVSPPPWPSYGLAGDCARKEILLFGKVDSCNFREDSISPDSRKIQAFFRNVNRRYAPGLAPTFVDLFRVFCAKGSCQVGHGEKAFYGDGGHLSMHGSRKLMRDPYFVSALKT